MKIISIKALKGPNYWSGYRKNLIEMKLDLGRFEALPTNLLPGFTQQLLLLLPGLRADHCSEGHEGGFVERLEEGTWLGHVIEHVALEMQSVAGMECGYGRTRSTGTTGIYHVVFAYLLEDAGRYAATAAVRLVEALANGKAYDTTDDLNALQQIANTQSPPPFARTLIKIAEARHVPVRYDYKNELLMLGQGSRQSLIHLKETAAPHPNREGAEPEQRALAVDILDRSYPYGRTARIPVVAVTGTNGKTTTTRLLAHIAGLSGLATGFTSTDGIYINNHLVKAGDCSGPRSAAQLLENHQVDFAVLECARGGILRSGLAFDHCNISIITNISEDHIGLADINSMAQLAKVKSVVAASTFKEGYAILNAADALVLNMRKELDCHIALFAIDGRLPAIVSHVNAGGTAAFIADDHVTIARSGSTISLMAVDDVPLTFHGTSGCMIQNVLAATLAAFISGFRRQDIIAGLRTFYPSVAQTPGRLNVFALKHGTLILDYVHNAGGYAELRSFMDMQQAVKKTGIIYATGDRRPEDVRLIGKYAAEMFDEIIINNGHDPRGVAPAELTELLMEGIRQAAACPAVTILPDEGAAITHAVDKAMDGELVFASINDIQGSLVLVDSLLNDAREPGG